MRKNSFLFVVMLFTALSLGFASCDNDKGNDPDDPTTGNDSGKENNHTIVSTCTDYVDLGLSVKWATFNIGASSPEKFGCYFAWGETTPKTFYDWSTYKWMTSGSSDYFGINKYTIDDYAYIEWGDGEIDDYSNHNVAWYDSNLNFIGDNKTILDAEDDAATVNMGGEWRIPTIEEIIELRTKCTWTRTTLNGVKGYNVEGPNGNSIFLPTAGSRYYSYLHEVGYSGYYWSSSIGHYSERARILSWYENEWDDANCEGQCTRDEGLPVRGVLR